MSLVNRVVGEMEGQRALTDCEIRDFEAFSSLVPPSLQAAVLEAIRGAPCRRASSRSSEG
ncbi:MAG: hypothetical protein RXN90_03545 [Thermoproteus sp.]